MAVLMAILPLGCQFSNYRFVPQGLLKLHCIVANTAGYQPNWATLKSLEAGQKTVGQVASNQATFHPSTSGSSLLFKFANFLSIRRVCESFQCPRTPRTFFSSILRIKTSWKAINFDYPLYAEVNNLIVFPPNWVFFIIVRLKSTQIREIGCIFT